MLVFPPAICSTALRPDAVLWSSLSRTVILLELTCPAEEGIEAAQIRKEATTVWSHNNDLVVCRSSVPTLDDETALCVQTSQKLLPNIVTLKRNGIKKLYHFTDASNLPSIEKHGLMSASNLVE